ncbi:TetR/AcrR family transcriptional regulator [Alkalihalobacillus sp. BA299]|uniref:TetR/AcrR family transcriptional regulator n=1 Tax=Alkalihalobacillus sp. BA299 TaxID=2815938 RepID=UPI001ADB8FFC|nr:TetR/AcrR family transcriptional regulator [Alkalihalobacillus sp. BA299]
MNIIFENNKTLIIQSAINLYSEKGFEKTTINDIAKFANTSVGSVCKYGESKGNILFLVIASIYEELMEKIIEFGEQRSTDRNLFQEFISFYIRTIDEMKEEIQIIFRHSNSIPKYKRNLLKKKEENLYKKVEELINLSIRNKGISIENSDVNLLTHNIIFASEMLAIRSHALENTVEMYIDFYVKLFRKVISK